MSPKSIISKQHFPSKLRSQSKNLRKEMTGAESRLWTQLRSNRLEGYHFRRQQVIAPYIVDFYCHSAKLVIEVDGGVHMDQEEYDREREKYLTKSGLKVLRFTNKEVNGDLESVLGATFHTV